jgi:hypothetical protein
MEASSMWDLASGALGASLRPLHLCASRAEQLAAQSQAPGSRVPQALGAFVVRSACCCSRPLRKRSSRVSRSTGRGFQVVVGASRRLNSQQLSAAMEGSARPARVARPKKYSAKENAGRRAWQGRCRAKRDAQPFHREDSPRQAGSSLSCQTLGAANASNSRRLV